MPVHDREFDKHSCGGANAKTAADRRIVLDKALVKWNALDVGKIQRVEPPGKDFYYAVWLHPVGVADHEDP